MQKMNEKNQLGEMNFKTKQVKNFMHNQKTE